ncbi:HAD family hydrolase [Streptomyces lavendulocolor]|uniref:HAD family hydrolase n=1 Tax=Streptomyces lavendulocolor TaxID=67316 RepID=UPI0033D8E7BD
MWDWSGTLLDDSEAAFRAMRHTILTEGSIEISSHHYRRNYTQPLRDFFSRLIGHRVSLDEHKKLAATYYAKYKELSAACKLTPGAAETLAAWRAAGGTQSLLSLYPHDSLLSLVQRYNVDHEFNLIQGSHGLVRAGEAEIVAEHLNLLNLGECGTCFVGDSPDDARAAGTFMFFHFIQGEYSLTINNVGARTLTSLPALLDMLD